MISAQIILKTLIILACDEAWTKCFLEVELAFLFLRSSSAFAYDGTVPADSLTSNVEFSRCTGTTRC